MRRSNRPQRQAGLTLVELLVAIGIMAVMALLSWRGIDGLLRTQQAVRERTDEVAVLQTGLAQWNADLEAMVELAPVPALDFDGRVLRVVRVDRSLPDLPVRVVGWSRRATPQGGGHWVRWQSPPVRERQALLQAWQRAQQWAQMPSAEDAAQEVAVVGLDRWQLLYFRNNAWSNPLSSAGNDGASSADARSAAALPDGIRLILRLPAGHPLAGEITRDWMRPVTGATP